MPAIKKAFLETLPPEAALTTGALKGVEVYTWKDGEKRFAAGIEKSRPRFYVSETSIDRFDEFVQHFLETGKCLPNSTL